MSFFRYPGGKHKLRSPIVSKLMNLYEDGFQYREPFFGGGSIGLEFLSIIPATDVWINDKDVGLYCLWKSVIEFPNELCEKVKTFQPATKDFYQFKEELLKTTEIPTTIENIVFIGFMKLAIHQISFSGLGTKSGGPLGGKKQKSKYKIDCRWSPDYMTKKIFQIHYQLKPFSIIVASTDFSSLIEDVSKKSLIYLDPPYYIKGNDLYQYKFSLEDHQRLANLLKTTPHKWLLSYDDCPDVRALYDWANIIELGGIKYTIKTSRIKPEILITKP